MPGFYSSPEDLYGLAQSSGYFNDPNNGPAPGTPATEADSMGVTGRDSVMPGELNPPTLGGEVGYSPEAPQKTKESASASYSGFSPDMYDKLSKQTPEVNAALKGADARAEEEGQRMLTPLQRAHDAAVAASNEQVAAQAAINKQNGLEAEQAAKLEAGFARDEAKANADSTALSNQTKADYMAALMDFRASKVDPSQLWHSQSGGAQFGMLVTAFVHDFLGARGIHTSAMDTFNKAIDRNIDAQVQGIKVKGEVTDGFKSLWYMQRNQSASEAEARLRVRGFMLDAAKQQATAHLAKYQSALATAQGHAALAALDEKQAANIIDIYKHVDDNALTLRDQGLKEIQDKRKNAREAQHIFIELERLKLEKAKFKKENEPNVIINPETGYAAWEFISKLEPGEEKQVRDLLANKGEMNKAFNDLRKLMRESPSAPDMIAGTRLAGTDQQRFDSITKRMAHSMVHANGERATDNDVKDYLQGMRPNTWLNQADADKVMAQTQALMMRETDSYLQQKARDLPLNDPRRQIQGARASAFAGSAAETNSTLNHTPKSKEQEKIDQAIQAIQEPSDKLLVSESDLEEGKTKPDGDAWDRFNKEPLDTVDSGANVRAEHNKFVKEQFGRSAGLIPLKSDMIEATAKGYNLANGDAERPKAFEAGMVRLKEVALTKTPEAATALHQLAMYAMPYVGHEDSVGDHDDYKSAYALHMLNEISQEMNKDVSSSQAVRSE